MFEPNETLQVLSGRGHLSAEAIAPVRVRYKVTIAQRQGVTIAYGTLTGSHAALRPIWLTPDATLRLKSGHRLEISLTDLVGDLAEFESTGPVGPV